LKPSNGLIKKRKQHPNREIFMIVQMVFSQASKDKKEEASQPQQDSALDHK